MQAVAFVGGVVVVLLITRLGGFPLHDCREIDAGHDAGPPRVKTS